MMYKQCIKFLEDPIQVVDTILLPNIELKIADNSRNIERIQENISILETMEEEVQEYVSEQLENIQQIASNFFMRRVSPIIEEEMQIFRRNCIDSVNRNYTFGRYLEVQTRNIADSGFTSEPSRTITGFVRNRTRNWRILNSALAAASAGASVLATGAGFMTAIALNILAVPVILSSGVIISGLSGTAYFIRQFINTTDQSMELSEEDVVTLCDQIKSDIRINSAGRIKQKFEQVVEDALRDYNRLLKAKYDREWGQRLNQCLEEAQVSLTLICKEKTDLTQACDELRQYSDSLKVLVQETE
ncbi:PREDICTED: uncharacterized protein LOC105313968 isoform X4 [Amphimedon queenslandica]|uniref:Uncharacterized protein n=1 Tax=Amphimedon queenslandica TaxID=400682 RepID=A0AAN0JHL7_AMPQE|nr:PREDICTED: uncharacterized protein LOC105313968 isoform X4 [Amphimedon queenslandica]|eukprot:XP_019856267.1 PREDICTED: uncharacterized protein LOC105313968 isoform X4 [Amphimedon queenslandica]